MCQHKTFNANTEIHLMPFTLAFICLILSSCLNPLQPVSMQEEEEIKAALKGRSFRQFDPSKDGKKRKGAGISQKHSEATTYQRSLNTQF